MKKFSWILAVGAVLGAWLSATYICPSDGRITLTQAILQLSGSRGIFALGTSFTELLGFSLRLIPILAFQALAGIRLYRHYCVASVYVFSRIPRRTSWYLRQVGSIAAWAATYQLFTMMAVIAVAAVRYELVPDDFGVRIFLLHFLVCFLWTVATTMAVNLVAVWRGSDGGFLFVAVVQAALIAAFALLNHFSDDPRLQSLIVRVNPISCLVLGWHSSKSSELSAILASPYGGIYPAFSIVYVLILCVIATVVGGVLVSRHDLLASNTETGGN